MYPIRVLVLLCGEVMRINNDFESESKGMLIFCGNSNQPLTEKVCEYLNLPCGKCKLNTFSDGEIQVEIHDNVRSKDVYVIQSTCSPVNNHLMELLLMVDALKRASARRITAVIPYYGYARQDRKVAPRVPISAKLVADLLARAGVHRVITMDLHAGQIQGFFDIPVDNLFATPVILEYLKKAFDTEKICIVSPDAGGVERARAFATRLHADLAIIDKRRSGPNQAKAMAVIGDVSGKIAVIIDDIVDTAGTMTQGVDALLSNGALEVHSVCTHPVLSGPAVERITGSALKSFIATDTIPLSPTAAACNKIKVLSIAELVGETIIRSYRGDSVTSLFV